MTPAFAVWILCFLYGTFFLGSFPLPPVPGRPFAEENLGISRFAFFNPISRELASLGQHTSIVIALLALFAIFGIWLLTQHSKFVAFKHSGFPIFRFLIILSTAFVAADYAREFAVPGPMAYARARADWITNGGKLGYPRWPTVVLKNAIIAQIPDDLDTAIDGVEAPPFGKIPAFPDLPKECRATLRELFIQNPLPREPGIAAVNYPPACRILKEIVARLGKYDPTNVQECWYGPAVKLLHALDRQKASCALNTLEGENSPKAICPRFYDEFGTRSFAFCPPTI
ncbi:MAG: hypothetical protein JST04_13420 [Bdellovibrionales bacterium]|nr:hypothetical protein [Bdellovibrionales bacterium]